MIERAPESIFGASTGARVAEYVRQLIWDGVLGPGDRVRQEEIASALGVSRVPVREGLVALESEGLVRHEPQRGVFVIGLDRESVRDHYELLGLVYGYVIEQAAERADSKLASRVEELGRRVEGTDDPARVFPLALEFKEMIHGVAGSARTQAAVRGMERLVPGNLHERIPGAVEINREGIMKVAAAIGRGDGPAAAEECRRMTRQLGRVVVEELERRGMLD